MSMIPLSDEEWRVPEETARIVQAVLPERHPYRILREKLGILYRDEAFADLYRWHGPAAESPGRLGLVLILAFAEGLTDEQAANAVRMRLDWKYLLGLGVTDRGFDASVLSEFRTRLVAGEGVERLLNGMLTHFRERGLLDGRTAQRTDSTYVLDAVQKLNRLELVNETIRAALEVLARVIPDWIQAHVPGTWYERYAQRMEEYRLPRAAAARQALARQIGADGMTLWTDLMADAAVARWCRAPALETLRRVWIQNFTQRDGQVEWRASGNLPPAALMIASPYDVQTRYSQKRATEWTGYKMHLTETCGPGGPQVITQVTTTPATQQDTEQTEAIQQDLAARNLLPKEHIVDAGYTSSPLLVSSATRGVELLGPLSPDNSPQARHQPAYAAAQFQVDWDARQITCPQGKPSKNWSQRNAQKPAHVAFDPDDCAACPVRAACVHSTQPRRARTIKLRPREQHEAQQAARAYQHTEAFKARYAKRSGIEATLSQAVRAFDVRATRYIGLAKTHLQHICIAVGINLQRFTTWISNPSTIPSRRRSNFAALKPAACPT
jgi:transposase